jgi:hypothetical protein
VAVPERAADRGQALAEPFVADQLPPEGADLRARLNEVREPGLDGLRALGRVPDHDERPFQHGAFFLDPAGVGDDETRVPGQPEERPVIGRGNRAQPVKGRGQAGPPGGEAGPGVQREEHRQAQLGQFVKDGAQPLRVVGVLRPVDRGQDVPAWISAEPGHDLAGRRVVRGHRQGGLDDRVPGQDDLAGRDALTAQVRHGALRRCAVQVSEGADHAPVQFLGHGPVE